MKKVYPVFATLIIFTVLVSTFSPVIAIEEVEENFSTSPSSTAKSKATTSASPKSSAQPSTSAKPAVDSNKSMTVFKGEVSATPSAVGRFLIRTDNGEKTIDSDKSTKVYLLGDRGTKTISTVARLKVGNQIIVVGSENQSIVLAKYVLVKPENSVKNSRTVLYGVVESREASSTTTFVLQVKSPTSDEKTEVIISSDTTVKVKGVELPKLSDIKIGDRVILVYTTDANSKNLVQTIYAIPGRASGLLRDIREDSETQKKSASPSASSSAKATATASPRASSSTTPGNNR